MGKAINKIKYNRYFLFSVLLLPLASLVYEYINRIGKEGKDISTFLDTKIPFIPEFIFVYLYWFVFIYTSVLFIIFKDRKTYIKIIFSILLGIIICQIIFVIYPTEITRPEVSEYGVVNNVINFVYNGDRPINCFPSIHVLEVYILMRFVKKSYSKVFFYYTQFVSTLIIFSTFFVKQHFVLDAIGSIILGEIIIRLVIFKNEKLIDKIVDFIGKENIKVT